MAGIYIHIPFCMQRCTYCDFYTEVAPQYIPALIDSMVKEINIRKDYLQNSIINTIYFGGGTPSILNYEQFNTIFGIIYNLFTVADNAEVTFEANPDDLTPEFLTSMHSLPFNRISIGIQSFDDTDLKRINRRHSSQQAINAVRNAKQAGFDNISIDLIYGLPFQTLASWEKQLDMAVSLGIQHISAYGLTYEEGTVLWNQREKGELETVDEIIMNEMYQMLRDKLKQKGFEAYEISNFALPLFRSKHNSSYWKQESYLGIGPSAHSYDLVSRQWNISSIKAYIKAINENSGFFERELLSLNDRYNDFVMVSLRTSEGIDVPHLEKEFGTELAEYCLRNIKTFMDSEQVYYSEGKLRLTPQGIQISNLILIQLMKV